MFELKAPPEHLISEKIMLYFANKVVNSFATNDGRFAVVI
jgi:hypothetical protein